MIKQNKKLTQEEIQQVTELRNEYGQLVTELGTVEIQITNLNKLKEDIFSKFKEYQTKEQKIANELEEKYGSGQISIETGEVIQV
jgi:hypothetical protein